MVGVEAGSFRWGGKFEDCDVWCSSWGGGQVSLSLWFLDKGGKVKYSPRISFACSNPFRMCPGGGSPSGILQVERRSCGMVCCHDSVAGCIVECIWLGELSGADSRFNAGSLGSSSTMAGGGALRDFFGGCWLVWSGGFAGGRASLDPDLRSQTGGELFRTLLRKFRYSFFFSAGIASAPT